MIKTIMILAITTILVTVAISSTALAQGPPSQQGNQIDIIIGLLTNSIFGLEEIKDEVRDILGNVTSPLFGLEEIKNEVEAIEEKLDSETTGLGAIKGVIDTIDTEVGAIETKLDGETSGLGAIKGVIDTIDTEVGNIETKLDDSNFGLEEIKDEVTTIESNQFVPFVEVITPLADGLTCATLGEVFNSDQLRINNTATSGNFVVTSILMLPFGVDESQDIIRIDSVRIQNAITNPLFKTLTQDLTGLVSTSPRAFDIMGVPLAANGNFPTQITAASAGVVFDIGVTIFCNVGTTTDISFAAIQVSGWKQVGDTINLTYSETPI